MKSSKILVLLIIGCVMLNLIAACVQKTNRINTAGSTTVLPIVQAAAEVYMQKNPKINISVRGGGTGIGIKSMINENIDIGNASRKINKRESDLIEKDLIETAIARDAISIVVHKDNPIFELTLEQLKKIYSGEINNWRSVGGNDKKIIVISRDISSGSFEVFNEVVLDSTMIKNDAMKLSSNNAVATAVSYTPGAIGYIGLGYVKDNLKVLKINGVLPTRETAMNNEYILTRFLYMYTTDTPKKLAQEFIDFILSEEGQNIVEEQGYVRIK
jgi:phosphate transport system substrate-binding protein